MANKNGIEEKRSKKVEKMRQEIDRHLMRVQMQAAKTWRFVLLAFIAFILAVYNFKRGYYETRIAFDLMFLYYVGLVIFSWGVYARQKYHRNL